MVDIDLRHEGQWNSVVKTQFLNSRLFKFGNYSFIAPVLELVNHQVRSFSFITNHKGISSPNYPALNGEINVSNNKHIFKSSLKIKKPKIAILSGKLNFNTPHIINNLNADYDHFYPNPVDGNLDVTDFWFSKYDIIFFDNFLFQEQIFLMPNFSPMINFNLFS